MSRRLTARGVVWLSSSLFFLSGFTGLSYEVIWFKRFSYVWGNSSLAMAAVVASFLFGLGLGAHWWGRFADRTAFPLGWYGVCEAAIGLLALLVPWGTAWLAGPSAMLYPLLHEHPVAHALVRCLLTFLVLAAPCILMGGTLPLLVRQLTALGVRLGDSAGWLYAVNCLGAGLGCYAVGFHLLPWLGMAWTNTLTAVANVSIGLMALLAVPALRRTGETSPAGDGAAAVEPAATSPGPSMVRPGLALRITAAMTGCAALVLQMVWARQLALILGGSTYAFTAVLFVVLVGMGLGSLVFRLWIAKVAHLAYTPGLVVLALTASLLAGHWLIPAVTSLVGLMVPIRGSEVVNGLVCVAASVSLELLPAVGMGILFPVLVQLLGASGASAGRTVGSVYAWNTCGTIAGAALTNVLLIPWIGTTRSVALAMGIYCVAMFILLPQRHRRDLAALVVLAVLAGLLLVGATRPHDPRVTNRGMYLYGYRPVGLSDEVLSFREGASCNVLIMSTGEVCTLRVNGKVDASTSSDMAMQLGLAYFPRFLRPSAQRMLVVGFGSGSTCGASLLMKPAKVVCCEIEPAVLEAAGAFAHVNHRPHDSRDFSVVLDDGRAYLGGTADRFDLILSEPSNPWLAGVSNLFTREFYELAKTRLTSEGLLAQWIQAYSLSPDDYAMIVRTVAQVFPHLALVRISEGDTILMASQTPIPPTAQAVRSAQALVDAAPEARADLQKHFGSDRVGALLPTRWILGDASLRAMVAGDAADVINTDVNLRLEFDSPRRLFDPRVTSSRVANMLFAAFDANDVMAILDASGAARLHAGSLRELAALLVEHGQAERAGELVKLGLSRDPQNPQLLAEQLALSPPPDANALGQAAANVVKRSPEAALRAGVALGRAAKHQEAAAVFEQFVAAHPNASSAWAYLGMNYARLGQREKAEKAFLTALEKDPIDSFARRAFEEFRSAKSEKPAPAKDAPHDALSPPAGQSSVAPD
jgi:spermidine synthase